MTAWDLSMDPVWAEIYHAWVWRDGEAYYGVPISNFFGWLLPDLRVVCQKESDCLILNKSLAIGCAVLCCVCSRESFGHAARISGRSLCGGRR